MPKPIFRWCISRFHQQKTRVLPRVILHILRPLKQQAEKLEAKFQRLNEQQLALATKLEDSTIYQDSNKDKLKKLLVEKVKIDDELADVEVAYLQALEAYEIAGGQ